MPHTTKCDIYVSYHPNDLDEVEAFLKGMRHCSLSCWKKKSDSGDQLDEAIRAMTYTNIFLCFFSTDYKKSITCRSELSFAIEQKKRIYFFIFDDANAGDYIKKLNYEPKVEKFTSSSNSLKNWSENHFEIFEQTIEAILKENNLISVKPANIFSN